jgi:hypothetical protein
MLAHCNALTPFRTRIPHPNCGEVWQPLLSQQSPVPVLMDITFPEGHAPPVGYAGTRNRFRRRALVTTLTLENAIARAANMGESRMPRKG